MIGAVNVFLPFMVLPIYAVVKLIEHRYGGGGHARLFALALLPPIVLPLTMPGVIAGIAFVFSMAVSMYVIPTLIGDRYQTLSTIIARSFLFMRDRPRGSAVAMLCW